MSQPSSSPGAAAGAADRQMSGDGRALRVGELSPAQVVEYADQLRKMIAPQGLGEPSGHPLPRVPYPINDRADDGKRGFYPWDVTGGANDRRDPLPMSGRLAEEDVRRHTVSSSAGAEADGLHGAELLRAMWWKVERLRNPQNLEDARNWAEDLLSALQSMGHGTRQLMRGMIQPLVEVAPHNPVVREYWPRIESVLHAESASH